MTWLSGSDEGNWAQYSLIFHVSAPIGSVLTNLSSAVRPHHISRFSAAGKKCQQQYLTHSRTHLFLDNMPTPYYFLWERECSVYTLLRYGLAFPLDLGIGSSQSRWPGNEMNVLLRKERGSGHRCSTCVYSNDLPVGWLLQALITLFSLGTKFTEEMLSLMREW